MNTKQAPRLAFSFLEAGLACAFIAAFFFVPQAHFGFSTRILDFGDEGLLWYVSQRTALGEIPLRDFFSYDPGRYYWSAFVFKLAGKDGLLQQIVADQLFGLIGVFVTYFAMCRLEIDRRWRVVIALLIGVAMGFPRHKIYEQTLSLISALAVTAVLCKPSPKRWFCFGIITGGAAFIGRNSGAYFTIAALLTLIIVHFLSELPSAGISGGKALAYFGG